MNSTIDSLITGYKQFYHTHYQQSQRFDELVQHGQKPKVLMVACCDSRVDPAIITGCQPGEIFVVRNVANLVPPFESDPLHHGTSAALEFGVLGLEVSDIIVLGHSNCGGVKALMSTTAEQPASSDFIDSWMNIARPAKQQVLQQYSECSVEEQVHHCEKASLLISLKNLTTFPWIQQRVSKQQLFLHAWYFDMASGMIESYQPTSDCFVNLDPTLNKE